MAMVYLMARCSGILLVLLNLASLMINFVLIDANTQKTIFFESFDTSFDGRWIVSKSIDYEGKWKYQKGNGTEDYGLLASEPGKKYGIAVNLPEIVEFTNMPTVLQYDLRLQNELDCGGAYLKFLLPQEDGWTPSQFNNTAPYSIMFGPDRCGQTNKVHFIFRHKIPKTGNYVEHHLKFPPIPLGDQISHVYTAVIYPNNTLQLLIDGEEIYENLVDLLDEKNFEPSVIPPKTIPDPKDKKPEEWDERAKIPDPKAIKPKDWDENAPRTIDDEEAKKPKGWLDDEPDEVDDPKAIKPKEWDDEEDGEWEAPKVPNPRCYEKEALGCGEWVRPKKRNPAYKGKWSAPLVDNPTYMGIWKPRDIDNPNWFEFEELNIEPIAAIGIEIWTMQEGILFDNILITHDEDEAAKIRDMMWKPKYKVQKMKKELEERARKKGPNPLVSFKDHIFELLYQMAEQKFLAPYKEKILELMEMHAEKHQTLTIVGIFGSIATILAFLHSLTFGRNKVPMSTAKKEDISTPDDCVVDEHNHNLLDKTDEPIEGTVDNVDSSGEIEKEEEPNAPRRRHHRET